METIKEKADIIIEKLCKFGEWLFKYRYYIAIVIFLLCILFEVSGSSIGIWKEFGMSDVENTGVILGTSRKIRSDEWAVLTPMTFSQKFDGFKYFSDIIRGDKTDVFIVYGLPTLNLMQVFRPFQLGFLFLGLAKGLSFFWCGRLIVLFLIMIELFMLITKKNKLLSVIAAILITLGPAVQWWFAVNGIAEILIFGSIAILLLDKYMKTDNFKKRCLYLLGMVISAGGYLLVFYPAWQVSMAYVFLALAIWVIIKNWKTCKINYKDIISIIVAIIIFAGCMAYIFIQSIDTIKAVMNTVYPGSRAETGGGQGYKLFEYVMTIFLPFKDILLKTNTCEKAVMFTLFPIGLILAGVVLFKEKKKDKLLISSLVIYVFIAIWITIGFPEIIAKITLMGNVQAGRAVFPLGVLEIIILIRSLSLIKDPFKKRTSIAIATLLTIVLVSICKIGNRAYITPKMAIAMAIMCMYLFYFILRYKSKYAKYLFLCGITFVMFMAGGTVNPIQKGVDIIYESSIIKEVQKINNEESGKWIVEGISFPIPNYILMAGVPVINTTNVYPDMDRWHMIDTERKYEDVYNRYAHINVYLTKNKNSEEKFEMINDSDSYKVDLTIEELKQLDVKYIFTVNDLEEFNTDEIKIEKVTDIGNYKIFKIRP